MSSAVRPRIELPAAFHAFAEERVKAGEYASIEEVVVDALEKQRLAALRSALDEGIAELDAGLGEESSPADLIAEISSELALDV